MAVMPQYDAASMLANTVTGTPDEVIRRLKTYESMGYDEFSLWIDSGMTTERKKESLRRFIDHVLPAFG
jgi:alkanesulfonate monooxygenase SsuD/methylene tetrahydromethanopterin reductase-like flavin-dependent oxidoreductase (luciferase family)